MFTSITRPCTGCQNEYPHTFLGSCCPSCHQPNWKYQGIVMPIAFVAGLVLLSAAIIYTLSGI
jgi:hypothetical protein